MLLYLDQPLASLYASTLSAGTYIFVTFEGIALLPSVGGVVALIVIEFKLLQPLKADMPILVTPSGIVIEVNLLHLRKASSPILVTPSPIVIEVKLVQFSKTLSPILVTLSGILYSVRVLPIG